MGRQSSTLIDPFSPLHHQCAARTLSGWSSLHAPPIRLGSLWSGTISLQSVNSSWQIAHFLSCSTIFRFRSFRISAGDLSSR
jgi:hypothetical protein